MTQFEFNRQTSMKFKTMRFLKACYPSFVKYGFLSGLVYFFKMNLTSFFYNYFDLPLEKQKLSILSKFTSKAGENLSLLSPSKISEYITSLTNSTLAQAKVSTLEKTIHFLTSFFDTVLFFVLIYFAYAFVRDTFLLFKEKERENNIANLVVEKLLPLLKRHDKEL